jgi:hypothetical protein
VKAPDAEWRDWYSFLPWEDWRSGRPSMIGTDIEPALIRWVRHTGKKDLRKQRQERVNVTFGLGQAAEMDSVLSLRSASWVHHSIPTIAASWPPRLAGCGESWLIDRSYSSCCPANSRYCNCSVSLKR